MATQTDLDRFHIAWGNLQRQVNKLIPNTTDKVWAARNRMVNGPGGVPPKPS